MKKPEVVYIYRDQTIEFLDEFARIYDKKTVKELHAIIKHQANTISEFSTLLNNVASACTHPFTLGIKAAIMSGLPSLKSKLNSENSKIDSEADKIQSKKTFIE